MTLPAYPLTVGVLVVLMVAVVVASGVLESRDPKRGRHMTSPRASPRGGRGSVERPVGESPGGVSGPLSAGWPGAVTPLGSMPIAAMPVAISPGPGEPAVSVAVGDAPSELTVAPDPEDDPVAEESAAHDAEEGVESTSSPGPSQAVVVLVAGSPGGVQNPQNAIEQSEAPKDTELDGAVFELGPLGVDSELAGVLFAAYVASGAPEWSRVTGWVTAPGEPPSLGIAAGDRLRGKPAQVCALLECSHDGRNWVVLDHQTNIDLALDRRPPEDEVLSGLIEWWRIATSPHPSATPEAAMAIRTGVAAVIDELRGHPLEPVARQVLDAAETASTSGSCLEERVVSSGSLSASPVVAGSEVALASGRGNDLEPHRRKS